MNIQQQKKCQFNSGMTLVEVIIAMLILGLIAAGISKILDSARQSHTTMIDQNEAQKRAQITADSIVDGLLGRDSSNQLGYTYGSRGCAEVQNWNVSDTSDVTVIFKNEDGIPTFSVRYYLQESDLCRDRTDLSVYQSATDIVCRNVESASFIPYKLKFDPSGTGSFALVSPMPDDPYYTWYNSNIDTLATMESLRVSVTVNLDNRRATETSLVKFRNKI